MIREANRSLPSETDTKREERVRAAVENESVAKHRDDASFRTHARKSSVSRIFGSEMARNPFSLGLRVEA